MQRAIKKNPIEEIFLYYFSNQTQNKPDILKEILQLIDQVKTSPDKLYCADKTLLCFAADQYQKNPSEDNLILIDQLLKKGASPNFSFDNSQPHKTVFYLVNMSHQAASRRLSEIFYQHCLDELNFSKPVDKNKELDPAIMMFVHTINFNKNISNPMGAFYRLPPKNNNLVMKRDEIITKLSEALTKIAAIEDDNIRNKEVTHLLEKARIVNKMATSKYGTIHDGYGSLEANLKTEIQHRKEKNLTAKNLKKF